MKTHSTQLQKKQLQGKNCTRTAKRVSSGNRRYYQKLSALTLLLLLLLAPLVGKALAATEDELAILKMLYAEDELVIMSPARREKRVWDTAENVTVVTAAEIKAINAHTLADVLNYIPGVQIENRGVAFKPFAYIQGSEFGHVLIMIDGVTLNDLASKSCDPSLISVQFIERVEVIKGPASSAWGSSLGGVINIITKSVGESETVTGMLSGSYGRKDTVDFRAEASGKVGDLGYYVNFNKLDSKGLTHDTSAHFNSFYTKFRYDLSEKAKLQFTMGHFGSADQGNGEFPLYGIAWRRDWKKLFASVNLNVELWEKADLTFSFRTLHQELKNFIDLMATGTQISKTNWADTNYGGSMKFTWEKGRHYLATGFDMDDGVLESTNISRGRQSLEKWAFFANDTMKFNKFSITPGIRYDHTSTNGNFWSPGVGFTWEPWTHTLFRATVSRGFNIPSLSQNFGSSATFVHNPDLKMETVWSYQVGVETKVLKYLRLKGTLFRHDVRDAIIGKNIAGGRTTNVNQDRQRRQGLEIEFKTLPLHNITLQAGGTLIKIQDLDTGLLDKGRPKATIDIGLEYNDQKGFQAVLKGHYIDWNATRNPTVTFEYSSFVWDLYLSKRFFTRERWTMDAFFSARNISESDQYQYDIFPNAGRWVEGGIRVGF